MPKKLAKKKVKPKPKQKQKQKQRQSQRTSVTVNINTKSKTKRKAPRATNGNTSRVLQQFAQPLITLPSNLINPPTIPQSGLIPSPLQTRRNDGEAVSMGQRLGSDSAMRERMRAGISTEQDLSGFSDMGRSDSLRNYDEPERAYTASLSSGFTVSPTVDSIPSVDSTPQFMNQVSQTNFRSPSVTSSVSNLGLDRLFREPNYPTRGRPPAPPTRTVIYPPPDTQRTPFRGSMGGLSAAPPQPVGVPLAGNPSLFKQSSPMEFLPRRPSSDMGTGTTPRDFDIASFRSY
jgi:hypothetical protein